VVATYGRGRGTARITLPRAAMVRWEAPLVATAGVALGTAIALATLVPMTRGLTGEGPYRPPLTYAGLAGAAVALGLAATAQRRPGGAAPGDARKG
jgi:putative ABC transport system permease protein